VIRWRSPARRLAAGALLAVCACSKPEQTAAPPAPAPTPAPAAAPAPAPALAPAADEACGQIIVVSYNGAAHANPGVTRTREQAAQRARDLLVQVGRPGADFAALARTESDAPSSAPRGGVMGTYAKADWPALHEKLRDPLFALPVGSIAPEVIAADYGDVVLRRCPVEKAHARHILVRYKGAKNAEGVKRDKAAAKRRATELLAKLAAGADFAELAKTESEDSSAARGGDIGSRGRGVLALPFEQALFALKPGERSGVVETEFGFHIIERLPD
jgi:peptidyl-prolyl cis-trans isomerase SurA